MHIEGNYNYYIVALSIVIAIFASYAALTIAAKISHASGRTKYFWLLAGAFIMGNGVWSMHFVGMLAFHLHAAVKYDGWLTFFSLSASVVSSFIAFYITMPKKTNWIHISVGGFVMGSGIVTMHYMGMEAMIMPFELTYNWAIWSLSAVIALVASYAALLLFLRFRHQSRAGGLKGISAVIMGFAICGMHYTGMKAAKFHAHESYAPPAQGGSVDLFLLYGVTIMIFIILLVFWGAFYFDRNVLERMAYRDTITGLPNRNEMNRFFDTNASGERIGVLFLDLDRFKAINDTLGHNVGDMLVREVGARLHQFLGGEQQVFRIGGDEFLVIVNRCDSERAVRLAENILRSVKKVYYIDGNELYVTASIGISIGSIQDGDRSVLLKTADTAMYKAKGMGKNQICVYTDEMGVHEVRKLELEKDLQRALEHKTVF